MNNCRYEDQRNHFRCPEAASSRSPWCFWHNPEQEKDRGSIETAVTRRQNLTGAWLEGIDLTGANLENVCLYGAVLRFARLGGARLNRADLRYADLAGSDMEGAELADALLEGCGLAGASLRNAVLRYANAAGANMERADLSGTDLQSAHLMRADLRGATLDQASAGLANLGEANLSGASIGQVDLTGTNLNGADLSGADLRGVQIDRTTGLGNLKYDRRTRFSGIDTSAIDPSRFPVLFRDIRDSQFLADFRVRHGKLHFLWKLTSDCGRSIRRWLLVYAAAGLLFGTARLFLPSAIDGTRQAGAADHFLQAFTHLVTLGAAGEPAASTAGRILLLAERGGAFVLFGGLLSIFFQKLSRRG